MRIVSIQKKTNQPVYDIRVRNGHHYILENGVITHNSGLEYCASTIVFLSKSKDRDSDKQVTGAIIKAHLKKARLTIEEKKVETLLNYANGLDKYYGLLDLAEKAGIIEKVSAKPVKWKFPNGEVGTENGIQKNPEKFWDETALTLVDDYCKKEFTYGGGGTDPVNDEEENTDE